MNFFISASSSALTESGTEALPSGRTARTMSSVVTLSRPFLTTYSARAQEQAGQRAIVEAGQAGWPGPRAQQGDHDTLVHHSLTHLCGQVSDGSSSVGEERESE